MLCRILLLIVLLLCIWSWVSGPRHAIREKHDLINGAQEVSTATKEVSTATKEASATRKRERDIMAKELEERFLREMEARQMGGGAPALAAVVAPGRQPGRSTFQEAEKVCVMKGQRVCTRGQMASHHAKGGRNPRCGWIIADNLQPAIARLADVWADSDCPAADGADIYCCDPLNLDTFKALDEPYNRAGAWIIGLEAAIKKKFDKPIPTGAEFVAFGGGAYGVAIRKTALAEYKPINHPGGTAPKNWPSLTDVPRCQVNDTGIPSGTMAVFMVPQNLPINTGKPWGLTDSRPPHRVLRGDMVTMQTSKGPITFTVAPASTDVSAIESGQIVALRSSKGFLSAGKGVGTVYSPAINDQAYWKVTVQGENNWNDGSKIILTNISTGQYLNGLDSLSSRMEAFPTTLKSKGSRIDSYPCQRLGDELQYSRVMNGQPDTSMVNRYQTHCYSIDGQTFRAGMGTLRQTLKLGQEALANMMPEYNQVKSVADESRRAIDDNRARIDERRKYIKEHTPNCTPVKTCLQEIGCVDPVSAPSDSSLGLASINMHPDFSKYVKYTDIPACT